MADSSVVAAFARGALVVTPNKRLARDLVLRHDLAQRESGRLAWAAARAMPWPTFVGELWQQALDAGLPLPARRLDEAQAAHLWRALVASDLRPAPLMNAVAAAELAAQAWSLMHAYGEGGASWRGFAAAGADLDAFVRWAADFERATRRLDALDPARAADAIADVASALPDVSALDVVCTGFVERAPQQQRLLDALAHAGATVHWIDGDARTEVGNGRLVAVATPRDEIVAALAWAKARAQERAGARVAIVVHDLHERRAVVQTLAEDVLCPGLQWPGGEDALRPYDISAAAPLADVPLVAAALDLLALANAPLPRGRAAVLVRSRYLPGGEAGRVARAGVEAAWLAEGRREIALADVADAIARVDPKLAARWHAVGWRAIPLRGSPREYVEAWRSWLEAVGWCDGIALDVAELAARGAWSDLLADFVRLTAVSPQLTRDESLRALMAAAQTQPFEPEAPGARIRILGVLEAAGLAFDAAWIVGLSDAAWPRAPQPHPLLPIDWQRERGVPRATAARELAYARVLTAHLAACAPEVVFSFAQTIDDHPAKPSPLIAHLPASRDPGGLPALPMHTMFEQRTALESIDDPRAPAWAEGVPFRGGAALIEAQSACPFQAAARFRLRVDRWPDVVTGLARVERGRLVHAALAAFWREVRDQATLNVLSELALDQRVRQAVVAGRTAIPDVVWRALPPIVAAVEAGHVERVMKAWLTSVERVRPPFRVEATELGVELALAGHPLALRVDRVDALADGRWAIIDYKSGTAVAPEHWFEERPRAPQLGLYALALDGGPAQVAAMIYAQLKPGRVKAVGLADQAAAWPGLAVAAWSEARAKLNARIVAIADEAHAGDVRVAPRDAKACAVCKLHALCRIASLDEGEALADEDAA